MILNRETFHMKIMYVFIISTEFFLYFLIKCIYFGTSFTRSSMCPLRKRKFREDNENEILQATSSWTLWIDLDIITMTSFEYSPGVE